MATRDFERVALVTGAARGIGAATVATLAAQGYAVTALDACKGGDVLPGVGYPIATPGDLDSVASVDPEAILPIVSDVRDREALDSAVNATQARFGRLDAVVAAAGVVVGGLPQWETPDEHLRTLLECGIQVLNHQRNGKIEKSVLKFDTPSGNLEIHSSSKSVFSFWSTPPLVSLCQRVSDAVLLLSVIRKLMCMMFRR